MSPDRELPNPVHVAGCIVLGCVVGAAYWLWSASTELLGKKPRRVRVGLITDVAPYREAIRRAGR